MIRLIALIALLAGATACRDNSQALSNAAVLTEPCAEVRYHSDLQEAGCVYEAEQLAMAKGLNAAPVWAFYGYLHKHGDGFRLHVRDDPDAAFMALDLTKLPQSDAPYGLEPLVGWRTRIIGYYTSGDVVTPVIQGAAGTLQVLSIGYIGDPERPSGAYAVTEREATETEPEREAER